MRNQLAQSTGQGWLKETRGKIARKSFYFTVKLLDRGMDYSEIVQEKAPAPVKKIFANLSQKAVEEMERRNENGFFEKNATRIAKLSQKILKAKRRLLERLGLDEEGIVQSIGVERSFRIAKAGSHLDILNECMNLAIMPFLLMAAVASVGYIAIKNGFPIVDLNNPELADRNMERYMRDMVGVMKYWMIALAPAALLQRTLTKIGNWMDLFQHAFMESVSSAIEGKVAGAKETYRKFATESVREMIIDTAISFIPIGFIDIWRRIRSIKSEMRQLHHIENMEKLYKEAEAGENAVKSGSEAEPVFDSSPPCPKRD